MTDKNKKEIESKDKSKLESDASKKPQSPKKPFKWVVLWVFVALVLALMGIAGAAFVWLQFEQFKQQSAVTNKQELKSLDEKLQSKLEAKDVAQHVTPLFAPIQSHLEALEKNSETASQARDALTESTQKLFELYGRDKNGWQLAEVEYLLRIAQHRLVIENDFQGAAKTLKAADGKITEIADPGLLPVRVAISDERVLLQTRTRPDLVGIVLSLSRITKQIPLLDLSVSQKKKAVEPVEGESTNQIDSNAPWQDQVVDFVKGLVKVEPLKKSLSTPSVNLITAMTTLEEKLKLAKWAVLERDQQQYHLLIKQSSQLFKKYFDANNNYHAEIDAELERLLSLEIRPNLPDISTSLILLKGIMLKQEHQISQQLELQESIKKPILIPVKKEVVSVEQSVPEVTKAQEINKDEVINDEINGESNE